MKNINALVLALTSNCRNFFDRASFAGSAIFGLCLIGATPVLAEGTAQFYSDASVGGRIPFTYTAGAKSTYFVSATAGETIYLGSSALTLAGTSNITVLGPISNSVPNTASLEAGVPAGTWARNCRVDQPTNGYIDTRAKELAGPSALATGGYTACTYVVPTSGIYEVAIWGTGGPSSTAGVDVSATARSLSTLCATSGCNNMGVRAWDITVANAGVAQPGRVWATGFNFSSGNNTIGTANLDARIYGKLFVQTKDGFTYSVDTNGMDPNGGSLYSNNLGIERTITGVYSPAYTSASTPLPTGYRSQGPNTVDTASSWINRLFFNTPSSSALFDLNTSVAYATSPQTINITGLKFVGAESGTSIAGTFPLGGYVKFTSNLAASAKIILDLNNNGTYGDGNDRVLTNSIIAGANSLYWDGKDGAGTAVAAGASNINIQVNFNSGEVHFPVVDV